MGPESRWDLNQNGDLKQNVDLQQDAGHVVGDLTSAHTRFNTQTGVTFQRSMLR